MTIANLLDSVGRLGSQSGSEVMGGIERRNRGAPVGKDPRRCSRR